MREPLEPVVEDRLVDRLLEAPARLGVGHREHEAVAAAAEVEAGLGLDRHRQALGSAASGRRLEQLAAERPDRQLDRERGASSRDHGPQAITSASRVRAARGGVRSRTSTPSARRTPDELARDRRRVGDAVLAQKTAPSTSSVVQARHDRRVDPLDRDAERRAGARRAPRAPRGPPRSWRGTGSRPGGRAAGRAPRRTRRSPARAAPRRRSRTAAARRPSPSTVEPPATSPRSQRTTSRAPSSARWYATLAPAAPAPATRITAAGGLPAARLRSARAAARARPREPAARAARGSPSRPRGTGTPRAPSAAPRRGRSARASGRGRARPRPPGSTDASPETAPAAPRSRPWRISGSGPTKTSSPSTRYGSNRSHGVFETFSPAQVRRPRRAARSITASGTA